MMRIRSLARSWIIRGGMGLRIVRAIAVLDAIMLRVASGYVFSHVVGVEVLNLLTIVLVQQLSSGLAGAREAVAGYGDESDDDWVAGSWW